MIPSKYKSAHYGANRFKPLAEVIKWFEREEGIYSEEDIYELWRYFKKKAQYDLILLSQCGDGVEDWEKKIVASANIFNYCHNNIQKTIRDKILNTPNEKTESPTAGRCT